ncbi:AAA family ATPase [Paraburkholderia humisilvae]|uniref:DNA replication and repair protein RecF n=1 Tax=Paraburkholderia humisilvae TaxID=627669 RepID=A0A6J5DDU2_9BURK|nr:AAA family ATPase [Paraburkholderia humisilvae]CAB3752440.1 DNA replication and repair protein RecF [Paraburkholderia humisilvae]
MWISKIELTNFKSYQHAELEFPEPSNGRNIVLVGGMNGYGKTSILEALYLALYGKDAIIHLARAGLKTDESKGYPTFLERAFNGEAKRDGQDVMSIRVVINRTKTKAINIRRQWFFKQSGMWTRDEEVVVREELRGVPGAPMKDGKNGFSLSDILDDQFVPAHIAPFFFFDGEEVKKLADQSRIEQVKQGLEGLLGIVLLRQLAERLRDFETSKRSSVSSVDEENIQRMLESLTTGEARLTELRKDASESEEKLVQRKAERESFIERITASGGGGGDIATVKDLVEDREGLRAELRDVQKQLERILADQLPFHLMPKALLEDFKKQVESELALAEWQSECRTLQPKRDKFEWAFLGAETPAFQPGLTTEQLGVVKARIESAWASLFHPAPSNCADEVVHTYLHEGLREKALSFLSTIAVGQQDVHDLLAQQRNLTEQCDEIGKKISRVEGIDRDGTLAGLKQELKRVSDEIEYLEEHIRSEDREVTSLKVPLTTPNHDTCRKRKDSMTQVRLEICWTNQIAFAR